MATFTGAANATPDPAFYGPQVFRTTTESDGLAYSYLPFLYGSKTETHPDAVNPRALDGEFLWGYVDDFYNRIHLIPTLLNFGSVSGKQTRNFRFWSAYRFPTELTAIDFTDFDGISLFGIENGDTFGPLQLVTGQIEVSLVGPQNIDASVLFTLDSGGSAELSIIGVRGGAAVFKPTWSSPLRQDIEFKTSISSSLSDREQRQSERYEPRVRMNYPYAAFASGSLVSENSLREFLRTKSHIVASGPIWTDFVRVGSDTASGTDLIDVDSFPSWLAPGATIAVYDPNTNVPVLSLVNSIDVGLGQIEILGGLGYDIAADSKIYRFESLWFETPATVSYVTNRVSTTEVSLLIDPTSVTYAVPPAAPKTLAGREVFDTRENWATAPQITYDRVGRSLDYGIGVFQRQADADYTAEVRQLAFVGRSREDSILLRDVFIRARGRQGEFWRPSFTDDMVTKTLPSVGATTIVIEGSYTGSTYIDSEMHRGLRFTTVSGDIEDYTIVGMSFNDLTDETYIELGEGWRDVGAVENISRTDWLMVWRFATDTLTIEWVTDEVAQMQMTIQSLPSETPE